MPRWTAKLRRTSVPVGSVVGLLLAACGGGSGLGQVNQPNSPGATTDASEEAWVDAVRSDKVEWIGNTQEVFLAGPLGRVSTSLDEVNADELLNLAKRPVLEAAALADSSLRLDRVERGADGFTMVRYQQVADGRDVVGAELRFHIDREGRVFAANGSARGDLPVGHEIRGTVELARQILAERYGQLAVSTPGAVAAAEVSQPKLAYLRHGDAIRPVFVGEASVETDGTPIKDRVFIDAETSEVLAVHPLILNERLREVYDARNGTALPGTLMIREGGAAVSDAVTMAGYNNTGATYDFFRGVFGRDSYDNRGSKLSATVHYKNNYVNAFWNGSQMVYGDGDGTTSAPLSQSLDVTSHELSHGVTEYTAGLVYQGESGALNEAFSDIMAAATDAWKKGSVDANTWKVGDDIWTPATPGDALRYMDDPTADGSSYDYYPTRYTGSLDNGGVHWNSGIANLAFYLLSQGGKHPRAKTSNTVPALGIEKARAIFYRAQANYATSTTKFEGYRTATAKAADDLYGATAAAAVHEAWNAVGVPGGTTSPGGGTVLTNNVAATNLSGAAAAQRSFTFVVPAGASKVTFKLSGGTGDADMYIRYGQAPSLTAYDYRPYLNGNNETVTVNAPRSGTWYIMLNGYRAYSGVSLVGSY